MPNQGHGEISRNTPCPEGPTMSLNPRTTSRYIIKEIEWKRRENGCNQHHLVHADHPSGHTDHGDGKWLASLTFGVADDGFCSFPLAFSVPLVSIFTRFLPTTLPWSPVKNNSPPHSHGQQVKPPVSFSLGFSGNFGRVSPLCLMTNIDARALYL